MKQAEQPEGQILLIDKEYKWTSFDVIKKIRNLLKIKKAGHAGTLDPLATGLLIICTGKKTKEINNFMDMEKEYEGTMVLGKTTPSVDLETPFDREYPFSHITHEMLDEAVNKFQGKIQQTPPIYSAIKKDGDRLYNKARRGESVHIEPREVEVKSFTLENINLPEITFRLVCSKGFYVRSLVRDFAEALESGAYLKSLRRTRIGDFNIKNALMIQDLQKNDDA